MVADLDKAPRLSISIVIWILSSDTDTTCQLNQFNTNSEAAVLSTLGGILYESNSLLIRAVLKADQGSYLNWKVLGMGKGTKYR